MASVDNRVVSLQFDDSQFDSRVKKALQSLTSLGRKVEETGRTKGNISGVSESLRNISSETDRTASAVDRLANRFSGLGLVATTAVVNISNSILGMGKHLLSALTIDPIRGGLREYELQIASTQTIMANTGRSVKDVNAELDKLNKYADKTIYNFATMTHNAGMFTAAGLGLEDTTMALRGVGDWAAYAGANTTDMGRVTYQLGQALSAGSIRLRDWMSVENSAGMAGKKYKEAFIQTAREQGIAIDDLIKKNGSFRESLQEGWLTTDIFMKTMQKFTSDGARKYTEEMMRAGKMTRKEANAIISEARKMEDAATKVKTFTDLVGTTKEALESGWGTTWRTIIGDFDEAKTLWTSVSQSLNKIIDKSSDARNKVLADWSELGGRKDLIAGLGNIFKGIGSVVTPINQAFRDIFPPMTAKRLVELTKSFRELTESMKLGPQQADALRNAFNGLFTVVNIGFGLLKNVAVVGGGFIKSLAPAGNALLQIAGAFGAFVAKASGAADIPSLLNSIGSGISSMLVGLSNGLSSALKVSGNFFDSLRKSLSNLSEPLSKIKSSLGEAFSNIVSSITDVVKTGGLVAIGALLMRAFNTFKDFAESIASKLNLQSLLGLDNITNVFDTLRTTLQNFQNGVQAKTIMTIAASLALLAGSLFLLSLIDAEGLGQAVFALGMVMGELLLATKLMSTLTISPKAMFGTIGTLIALSVAVLAISGALKVIASLEWDEISRGLVGLGGVLALMVAALTILDKANVSRSPKGMFRLIGFAISAKILASALKDISDLDWEGIAKGVVGLGGVLALLALYSKLNISTGIFDGIGLIAMAQGLSMLSGVVASFSTIDAGSIAKAEAAIAGILTIVGLYSTLTASTGNIGDGVGLIAIGAGLKIIADVINTLGTLDPGTIAVGIAAMTGVMTIVGIFTTLSSGVDLGVTGVGLGLLAVGLNGIISVLQTAGGMDLGVVAQGFLVLAGAIAGIAAAGLLLTPAIPQILMLSGALLAIGAAVALVGVGLFGIGLAFAGFAFAVSTLSSITAEAAMSIGDNLATMAESIASNSDRIEDAGVQIGHSLLEGIRELSPDIVETMLTVMDQVLQSISDHLPSIQDCGAQIMSALLAGILSALSRPAQAMGQAMGQAVQAVVSKVGAFLAGGVQAAAGVARGIANGISGVLSSARQLVMSAVSHVRSAVGHFVSAGMNMALGVARGIMNGVGAVVQAVASLAQRAVSTIMSKLGIHSPSRVFKEIGDQMINGLVVGLTDPKKQGELAKALDDLYSVIGKKLERIKPESIGLMMSKAVDAGLVKFDGGEIIDEVARRYVRATGDIESATELADESVLKFAENLYLKSDAYRQDTDAMSKNAKKLQEYVDERNELQAQLRSSDAKTSKKIKSNIESVTNKIKQQMETIGEAAKTTAQHIQDVYNKLSDGISNAVRQFADPLSKSLSTSGLNLFSGRGTTSKKKRGVSQTQQSTTVTSRSDKDEDELQDAKAALARAKKRSEDVQGRSRGYINDVEAAQKRVEDLERKLAEADERISSQQTTNIQNTKENVEANDDILTIMTEQLNAYKNWQLNLQTLATESNIAPGLLAALKNLGVSGAEKVKEFVEMTNKELEQANSLYEETQHITAQTLLSGFQDSFNQAKDWAEKIRKLQEMGLNTDIVSKLAEKGPKSLEYVNAIISMTKEELIEFNSMYEDYLKLPATVSKDIMSTLASAGSNVGTSITGGLAKGLNTGESEAVTPNADKLGVTAVNAVKKHMSKSTGEEISDDMTTGLSNGLRRGSNKVERAARDVAYQAYSAAKSELGIHSPSRKFAKIGKFTVAGFVQGVANNMMAIKSVSNSLGNNVIDYVSTAVDKASKIASNMDTTPVIRPVIDTSDVENGLAKVGGMSAYPTVSTGLSSRIASGMAATSQIQNGSIQPSQSYTDAKTVHNNFYIKGNNPKEIAQEVSRIIKEDTIRRDVVWGR